MFGVSHGAIQFMTYEEMKTVYNQYRQLPIDAKLVCLVSILSCIGTQETKLKPWHHYIFILDLKIFKPNQT
jgi:hypothetical protein